MQENIIHILKVLTCAAIFTLTMEISARVDDMVRYNAPFLDHYSYKVLISEDEEGIRYNNPSSRYEKWQINNLGFRGPYLSQTKPNNAIRIFCMGASESFGLYENEEKEWPAQLRIMLRHYPQIEIVNSSVAGLGLDHYKQYINKYVILANPDIIILYINHFAYAAGIDKQRHLKNKLRNENMTIGRKVKTYFDQVQDNIRIMPKIKTVIKKILPEKYLEKYSIWKMSKEIAEIEKMYLSGKPLDEVDQKNLEIYRTDLEDLIKYLRARKIEIILSSYPSLLTEQNLDEYQGIFLDARRFCIKLSFKGMIDASEKFNKMTENIAIKYGIVYVENASAIPKNLDYFSDNVHYTDKGANVIANNIRNKIITSNKMLINDSK